MMVCPFHNYCGNTSGMLATLAMQVCGETCASPSCLPTQPCVPDADMVADRYRQQSEDPADTSLFPAVFNISNALTSESESDHGMLGLRLHCALTYLV